MVWTLVSETESCNDAKAAIALTAFTSAHHSESAYVASIANRPGIYADTHLFSSLLLETNGWDLTLSRRAWPLRFRSGHDC